MKMQSDVMRSTVLAIGLVLCLGVPSNPTTASEPEEGKPSANGEQRIYVAFADSAGSPQSEASTLQLGKIDAIRLDRAVVVQRAEYDAVQVTGRHYVEWASTFRGHTMSLGDTIQFAPGHVYSVDADRTHAFGMGDQYWFWIEDENTGYVVAGEKTPKRRTPAQDAINGFRNEAQAEFIRAVEDGDLPAVSAALDGGADPDWPDLSRRTPLMHAGKKGRVEVVKLLLEHGADVKARDMDQKTALHFSAEQGGRSEEIIQLLLERGADVNAVDRFGFTPSDMWTRSKVMKAAGGVPGSKLKR